MRKAIQTSPTAETDNAFFKKLILEPGKQKEIDKKKKKDTETQKKVTVQDRTNNLRRTDEWIIK